MNSPAKHLPDDACIFTEEDISAMTASLNVDHEGLSEDLRAENQKGFRALEIAAGLGEPASPFEVVKMLREALAMRLSSLNAPEFTREWLSQVEVLLAAAKAAAESGKDKA
jgi:hypothetical protein